MIKRSSFVPKADEVIFKNINFLKVITYSINIKIILRM